MRKVIISFAVLCLTALTINAQLFVGGTVSVDSWGGSRTSGTTTATPPPSTLSFTIAPKVGFYLNDDFAIGIQAGILSAVTTSKSSDTPPVETKAGAFGWLFGAFARMNLVEAGGFSFLLEGGLGISGATPYYIDGSAQRHDGDPVTIFDIGVAPVLSYSFSNALSAEFMCDFLRLGFTQETEKSGDTTDPWTNSDNHFGLGVNSNRAPVSVAVIFKF
ncbi:MAG: hypothetical protein FWH18_11885 [Marinilabiliaceae bacterium]|nr:hypothetical protein [Marinilabiliaceae bacterium]